MIKVKQNTHLPFYPDNPKEIIPQEQVQLGEKMPELTKQDITSLLLNFPSINDLFNKNVPNNQKKLIDYFIRAPTKSDCPGFIYGFMNQNQNHLLQTPYWIKIGRTKDDCPQNRILQWQKQQNCQFTQIFTFRTLYNRKLELLVHTLFAYARKKRIFNGKHRLEWFRFEQLTLAAAAVNILNHMMNIVHGKGMPEHVLPPQLPIEIKLKQVADKITIFNNKMKEVAKISGHKVAESLAKELQEQIDKDDETKKKLVQCNSIKDIVEATGKYEFGKQLKQCKKQIDQTRSDMESYILFLSQMEKLMIDKIKQIKDKPFIIAIKNEQKQQKEVQQSAGKTLKKARNTRIQKFIIQTMDDKNGNSTLSKRRNAKKSNYISQQVFVIDESIGVEKNKKNKIKQNDVLQQVLISVDFILPQQKKNKKNIYSISQQPSIDSDFIITQPKTKRKKQKQQQQTPQQQQPKKRTTRKALKLKPNETYTNILPNTQPQYQQTQIKFIQQQYQQHIYLEKYVKQKKNNKIKKQTINDHTIVQIN